MRNCSKEIDMMIEEREKKLDQKLGEEIPNTEESKEKKRIKNYLLESNRKIKKNKKIKS